MSEPEPGRLVQTSLRLPVKVWHDLRLMAERRALTSGGRPSLARVVAELVESKRTAA